jgi:hypothetical protein
MRAVKNTQKKTKEKEEESDSKGKHLKIAIFAKK